MFDSSSAKSGEDHTVNFKPEPGYYVGKVVVDGVGRDDLKDAGSIQFKGVASDHTIYIEFVKHDKGKISFSGADRNHSYGSYL